MKKILLIILSGMCAAAVSAVAYAETTVGYDMNTSSIIVSGRLSEDALNKEVSVNILYPGKGIEDIRKGKVTEAVAFSTQRSVDPGFDFSVQAKIDGDTGYYSVYYDYDGCEETKLQLVYYVNKEDNKKALQTLNDAKSAEDVYKVLTENSDDLCFDNEFEEIINMKRVSEIVFAQISDKALDVEDYLSASYVYNRACIYDALYIGAEIDFEKYSDELSLSLCKGYEWYENYKSDKMNSEIAKRFEGQKTGTEKDFFEKFDEAVVTSVVYMPNGSGNVRKIMSDFKDEIGISSLTNSENVYKRLAGDSYYSYSELKAGYEKEAKSAPEQNITRPSGGGSGSGGGGGSVGGMRNENRPVADPEDISDMYPNVNYDGSAGNFEDVVVVPWAKEAIAELSARGVISGDENGLFKPERFVTREEFAKILVMAFEMKDKGTAPSFADVSENDWYFEYIRTAYSNSVIAGMGDIFGVGMNITRQDMAVMLVNAAENAGKELVCTQLTYNDNEEIADYAKDSVAKVITSGIMKDIGNGYFNPDGLVTRAHAVYAVYLVLK